MPSSYLLLISLLLFVDAGEPPAVSEGSAAVESQAAGALVEAADGELSAVEPRAAEASTTQPSASDEERPSPKPIVPPQPAEIETAIARGTAYLLGAQNKDGSWGSAQRTKDLNIYAPVPTAHLAFRSGVSALCLMALIETGSPDDPAVQNAIERGEVWLLEKLPQLRRATADAIYNIWGHAYGIQALLRLLDRHPENAERQVQIKLVIEQQFDLLRRYESIDGGWGYYDFRAGTQQPASSSTSFITATVLIAFYEARQKGLEPPQRLIDRGLASLHRQLKPDFAYLYGEYLKWKPMHPVNRPGGSLGRSQACSLALRLWGEPRITDEVLETWLDRLIARNLWLDIGRKRPIPHESWFAVAGYFYYYGHYYAALCIEQVPAAKQPHFQDHLAHILLPLQEKDGSWWDYPLYNYHQQYGTAFAMMSLHRCRKH